MRGIGMKYKKAVSHVEMAISFTMFIMFIFFLLFYLKPIRSQNISDVLIDAIVNGLERNATLQLIEIPLTLKTSVSEDCFSLENPFETSNPQNMFLRDEDENPLNFDFDNDNIVIEKSGSFYYLFFAEELFDVVSSPTPPCAELTDVDYEYAAAKTYYLFSISKLETIKDKYDNNYENLKEDFNFPTNYDFIITITLLATKQDILTMEVSKPERVEVIAREIPIEILQSDGTILRAVANIQVW